MATGQDLLDRMELLDQELQLQSGQNDVARGLLALNVAQDYLESILALRPRMFGDTTTTVTASANTETTAFPTGWLRIDRAQWVNPATSLPEGPDLDNLGYVGSHVTGVPEFYLASLGGTGRPRAYWTQGRSIYWQPLPDASHTIRVYGLAAASAITAGGTFAYPDIAMLPLASVAVRIISVGVGDSGDEIGAVAQEALLPVVNAMAAVSRGDRPPGFDYSFRHSE